MQKHELDPHNTVGIFVPTGEDEESITELAAAMCGEQPEQVLVIEKAKMALVTFPPGSKKALKRAPRAWKRGELRHTAEQDALDHDNVLLSSTQTRFEPRMARWDVPSSIHRLHMFGSGRYRFYVERADKEPVELFKPIHPFMLPGDAVRLI